MPENIIKKLDRLTPEEFEQMKRQCEVGFRIAWSVPDLALYRIGFFDKIRHPMSYKEG
ncbi:MAG: hypothetical protein AB1341_09400 [Bacillota bacterium]